MQELASVLQHLEGKPVILQTGELAQADRTSFYVMHNRITKAIDLSNPKYKTMSDLIKESATAIREMHDDLEILITNRYSSLVVFEDILFLDVVKELGLITLDNYEDCLDYLAQISYYSIACFSLGNDLDKQVDAMLQTIIYLAMYTYDLLLTVKGNLPITKGVGISFERKR